jgi:aspartyl-tRNA(Asn)/glutamyl-tRNA(Gln) amidotransferase subunit C
MPLSLDDVRRIADLARIEVTADEASALLAKLSSIFGLIEELKAIDTQGVQPMSHARDLMLPLREDTVTESDRHSLYQQAAPATEEGLYLVPRVVE